MIDLLLDTFLIYPISFSRLVAGAASGDKFLEPEFLNAEAKIGETGVDEIAHANIKFKNGKSD